jgi:hypothetical protein
MLAKPEIGDYYFLIKKLGPKPSFIYLSMTFIINA